MPTVPGAKSWWRRPWLRHKGLRKAPRGGEVFPTGPQQVYRPEARYVPPAARETRADLTALRGRPYVTGPRSPRGKQMENPATWRRAERVINDAIGQYQIDRNRGVIGLSLTRRIADALRGEGLLKDES